MFRRMFVVVCASLLVSCSFGGEKSTEIPKVTAVEIPKVTAVPVPTLIVGPVENNEAFGGKPPPLYLLKRSGGGSVMVWRIGSTDGACAVLDGYKVCYALRAISAEGNARFTAGLYQAVVVSAWLRPGTEVFIDGDSVSAIVFVYLDSDLSRGLVRVYRYNSPVVANH